jgi:hypothetical protein
MELYGFNLPMGIDWAAQSRKRSSHEEYAYSFALTTVVYWGHPSLPAMKLIRSHLRFPPLGGLDAYTRHKSFKGPHSMRDQRENQNYESDEREQLQLYHHEQHNWAKQYTQEKCSHSRQGFVIGRKR